MSAHLLAFVHDHVWAPPSPRCAPFQPPRGTASATLVLVCPRPANPTDGVAVPGPLMGGCADGQWSGDRRGAPLPALLPALVFGQRCRGALHTPRPHSPSLPPCSHHMTRCHNSPCFQGWTLTLGGAEGLARGPAGEPGRRAASHSRPRTQRPSVTAWPGLCDPWAPRGAPSAGPLPPPCRALRAFLLGDRSSCLLLPRPGLALPAPPNEPTQENNRAHIDGAQPTIERDKNGASVFHGPREAHCWALSRC